MNILENINAQLEEFKKKRSDLVNQLKTEFPALITPLLQQSKRIESIGWAQYTPYFNDGDECVFRVSNDELWVNGEYEGESECGFLNPEVYKTLESEADKIENNKVASLTDRSWYNGKKIGEKGLAFNPEFDESEFKIFSEVKKVLQSVPEDFFKDLFGDHVKVTISKDGTIETDEYDHD
jgi:hypothetical protein